MGGTKKEQEFSGQKSYKIFKLRNLLELVLMQQERQGQTERKDERKNVQADLAENYFVGKSHFDNI